MTKQRIFNKVVNHLLTQGKKSVDGDHCRYYSQNGNKCAVGCLIGKKYYKAEMENRVVPDLVKHYKLPEYFVTHRLLLRDLQLVHDAHNVDKWKEGLIELAKAYNLKIPAILKS